MAVRYTTANLRNVLKIYRQHGWPRQKLQKLFHFLINKLLITNSWNVHAITYYNNLSRKSTNNFWFSFSFAPAPVSAYTVARAATEYDGVYIVMKNDRDEQLHANHARCRPVGRARNHAWWTIIIYNHRETASSPYKTKSSLYYCCCVIIKTYMENVGYNNIRCSVHGEERNVFDLRCRSTILVAQFAVNRHRLLIPLSGRRWVFFK